MLNISAQEYLRVYRGQAKYVSAVDQYGRRISFPVNVLQPFVGHQGIVGRFIIGFDQCNRFVCIRQVT